MQDENTAATPWLSLLVPVYGVERYLQACIESVLSQAVDGIEILLLNDASPDRSGEIAAELQARHPGTIRVIAHERNRGLSAVRNSLLAAARGRYLWFLDSDDELLPGAIAGLRAIVDADAPDLVLCDFRLLREHFGLRHRLRGELHRPAFAGPGGVLGKDRDALVTGLMEGRQLHVWSKIATAEIWQRVKFPEGRLFEDMAVVPQLVAGTRTWRHVRQPWVGYRQRGDSVMATMTPKKTRDVLASLRDLHDGLIALPGGLSIDARHALDYFCLRTFASLARKVPRDDAALADDCRDTMHAVFPQGVDALLAEYRRRGWWFRALRAQRSLARRGWLQ